jgi:predicted MPP superfamily phosphohydrolase
MNPYIKLQLAYVLAAGAGVGFLFWATGWLGVLRERLFVRFLLTGALYGMGGVVLGAAVYVFGGVTPAFGLVALLFYGGAGWLPVVTLLAARKCPKGRVPAVLASIVFLAVGVDALLIEPNRLVLREETIPVVGLEEAPFRLVHISDLQTVGSCDRETRAAKMVNDLDPDLIVVTGDYVAGPFHDPEEGIAAARAFFGSLKAKHGVVIVSGHSEPESVQDRVLDGLDVILLKNETRRIPLANGRTLVLHGIDAIYVEIPTKDLRRSPDEYVVVASHVPLYSENIDGMGFDLHLAGHTHGGQIVVPGFGPPITLSGLPRKYSHGLKTYGDHLINVTSGIGMEGHHAPRIRFFCPPEVCLITLGGGNPITPAPVNE